MLNLNGRTLTTLLLFFAIGGNAVAQAAPTDAQIRILGLEARLNPAVRNANMMQLADLMKSLFPTEVHALQGAFQSSLMLQCDPDIFPTLSAETIQAVDESLEGLFDFTEIARDTRWETLIYVYGFFNRDVKPEEIKAVLARWDALSDKEKAPLNPTYIHVIDAVCKPLVMGELKDKETTIQALEIVVPGLHDLYLAKAKPGTAFHGPSHGCLILGPLYDRWIDDPEIAPLLLKLFGDRAAFETLLASQLVGAVEKDAPLSRMENRYHFYIGSYLANSLARLDARSAVPALERSFRIYEREKAQGREILYTQRALLALGNASARADFEEDLKSPAKRETCRNTLVWFCQNGRGETKTYGEEKLGAMLDCKPEAALTRHLELELEALK